MPATVSASDYFPVHAHSEFSWLDGMGSVPDMVERVTKLGQPALALTDHGTMGGTIRLYKACMKAGIAPFPGMEAYVVTDVKDLDARERRFHLGIIALDYEGYQAMVKLSSRSYSDGWFHRKPLIDLSDLMWLGKTAGGHIAITTGCYFGLVVQHLIEPGSTNGGDRMVKMLMTWFKHVFVELQDHGVVHGDGGRFLTDGDVSRELLAIADRMGLPVVLGQDSHYCDASHQPVHNLMKDICYGGDGEDNSFPGGPYHLATTSWLAKKWDPKVWARIEEGHSTLLDLNRVSLPAVDTYKFCVPRVSNFPDKRLAALAKLGLDKMGFTGHPQYEKVVKHELSVIKAMGFANYFLMAWDIAEWCRTHGVFMDARGSANGSLVCYLLNITTIDSVAWDCDFSRFLSLDRKKPPDIDMDVESSARDALIAYVKSKYPTMVQIGSYGRLGITETEDGEEKGSVYVQYAAAMRRKGDGNYYGVQPGHGPILEAMADLDIRKGAGRHAGGFVIPGEGLAIDDYLPTMKVGGKNGHTATQYTMDDVEDCGYVKLDILGVQQLSTMRRVVEMIGKDPIKDGMGWIPNDDKKACAILRSGKVGNGVFQFEGWSTAKGAKTMKVQNTQEAIFCLALFRPAMMQSGMTDRYLAARAAKQRELVHPSVDVVMDDTWGVPVFQDQVIQIMRQVGLPYAELNDLLKAVKASNDKITEYATLTFDRVFPIFVDCAKRNCGCTQSEAENIWRTVMDFSDYGFNKSHATNYGVRAYRMAYLKAHYPIEFMAATLQTWAGVTDKEPKYVSEARAQGISIGRADVNLSDVIWKIDPASGRTNGGKLRKGLVSVKGIGESVAFAIVAEREANGPYADIKNFCDRLPAGKVSGTNDLPKGVLKGSCKVLVESGAMGALWRDT